MSIISSICHIDQRGVPVPCQAAKHDHFKHLKIHLIHPTHPPGNPKKCRHGTGPLYVLQISTAILKQGLEELNHGKVGRRVWLFRHALRQHPSKFRKATGHKVKAAAGPGRGNRGNVNCTHMDFPEEDGQSSTALLSAAIRLPHGSQTATREPSGKPVCALTPPGQAYKPRCTTGADS